MNLLIHDVAAAIELEAKDEPRSRMQMDPAPFASVERFTVERQPWRVSRFAFEVDVDERHER